jgi:hypothetical protein
MDTKIKWHDKLTGETEALLDKFFAATEGVKDFDVIRLALYHMLAGFSCDERGWLPGNPNLPPSKIAKILREIHEEMGLLAETNDMIAAAVKNGAA